jgi:TolB-like protein
MRANDKATMRIDSEVVTARRETARKERLNKMARNSAFAIQQKAKDVAAAEARASARIAAEGERRAQLASLVPPSASARVTRKKTVKPNGPNSLELALLEQEEKEAAAAERLEKRKDKAKEVKELFEKTQKAKKARNRQVRLEKRYDLDHLSYENAVAEKRTELVAQGLAEAEAEKLAKFWADHYADPKVRVYMNKKMNWGDIGLKETPPKVEPKPKAATAAAAVPLVPESSIRVPTMDYRKAARKAPEFAPDYKTLIVLNLPYEPGKKIDRRKLWTTVSGKMTGTEIFGPTRPTKEDVKVVIMIMRLNGTQPTGDVYQSKTNEPLKVMAFVTYPTHELAKRALEYSRMRGLYIKETRLVIQPIEKK